MIYLVRHAHADWSPDEQRPLSAKGREDALRVAELLATYSISVIYSSPYARARQTVEPLAARLSLPIIEHHDLRERQLSGEPVDDFLSTVKTLWENPTFAFPGGESNVEAQKRGAAVIQTLTEKHANEQIIIATHGNLLALMLQHFNPSLDFTFWQNMTLPDAYGLKLSTLHEYTIERFWKEKI